MLKKRLITAAILIPLFVGLVLILPPDLFCLLTGAFVLVGAWEWAYLMGLKSRAQCFCYLFFIFLMQKLSLSLYIPAVLMVSAVWWLVALVLVMKYPKGSATWGKKIWWRGIMGVFVLVPAWIAVNSLFIFETHGPYLLLFFFVLIWGADSGAYFVGKRWGKNKLLPAVSPGKTRQGLYGALLTALCLTLAALWYFKFPYLVWPIALSLSLITVLFSVLGDLFESMLKRKVGLKDSGNILPGHGGVLDRIDSLTAAAPIFALSVLLILKIYH